MPLRLKTRCRYPGCGRAVRGTYCEEHQFTQRVKDRGRGTAKDRGYDSQWERVASVRRRLDCYLCQSCRKNQRTVASKIVDHIIPIHVRPDWRLEIGNTQVLCNACHTTKTNNDLRTYGGRDPGRLTVEQQANRETARRLENPSRGEPDPW